MRVPFLLLIVSSGGLAFAVVTGRVDLALLLASCTVASLYLWARSLFGWFRRKPTPRWIVIDGSNVLHWRDGTPQLATLRAVVDHLTQLGFAPGVVLDANAGYKIGDRYQHDHAFGRLLGLPADRVTVVGKGTPADPMLLAAARDLKARVVSNDRFRDWADTYPEVTEPGHLIRGGFRDGKLWLDLD